MTTPTTPTSPVLDAPGAVPAPDGSPDLGVPWHFGDPFAEQRAAARSVAVVDRSNRELVAVTGEERLSWLHLVISQHVTELADGAGTEALVLDSQGRVDAHLVLAHSGDTVWLDTEPGATATGARGGTQSLLDYLTSMVFWSKVEPRDATAERAVLSVVGPETPALLERIGLTLPERDYGVAGGELLVRRMPWPGRVAADLLVPRNDLSTWWARLTDAGARPMGSWGFDALRVESARPRLGLDTDDRTIPHEVGWVGVAAHVAKGCYRGQETVAKVHNVGRPPRRMLLLHLDGSPEVLPETGDPVLLGERTVGRVGSVARHHELGSVALALVKYSVPLDAELLAGADDRVVQAAIDPDVVPAETPALGREAAKRLRG
ncbi:CAF17-like 4Fe-4S cluster assembly/insertion protein YgfZ [Actinophytocola xanthii]|uniref:Folate-binding protein YgfZ n=1 Tax=Actinophytocola xanthii TaxID=1912961 RepID=A0A1Q8C0Q9_9PSEU|nr:folate-binding protein YgfZ [Actinophytocola xanthii]OLF07909.1 folate-binding protein YgfZ [Actinophytocola xanthii]